VRALVLIAAMLGTSCGRSDLRALRGRNVTGTSRDGGVIRKDGGTTPVDAGLNECMLPSDAFNISAIRFDMGMRRSDFAEVVSVSPLNLRFFDGALFTFGYTRSSLFHRIGPGDVVFADIEVEAGLWISTVVAISESDFNGPGDLLAVGWTVADGSMIDLASRAIQYADDGCLGGGEDGCGPIVTRTLELDIVPEQVTLPPGDTAKVGEYTVGNGLSYRYEGQPRCTDIPSGWRAGFIELE
jgi:hypothetical protein